MEIIPQAKYIIRAGSLLLFYTLQKYYLKNSVQPMNIYFLHNLPILHSASRSSHVFARHQSCYYSL